MATRYNLTGIRGDTRTLNTAGLAFGLGFVATTGTPTIRIVQVQAYAHNLS